MKFWFEKLIARSANTIHLLSFALDRTSLLAYKFPSRSVLPPCSSFDLRTFRRVFWSFYPNAWFHTKARQSFSVKISTSGQNHWSMSSQKYLSPLPFPLPGNFLCRFQNFGRTLSELSEFLPNRTSDPLRHLESASITYSSELGVKCRRMNLIRWRYYSVEKPLFTFPWWAISPIDSTEISSGFVLNHYPVALVK